MARITITTFASRSTFLTHPSEISPLWTAVICGNPILVKELLRGDVNIHEELTHNSLIGESSSKVQGINLVQFAVLRGMSEILRLLLHRGANANSTDSTGTSVLHYCASHTRCDCIAALLYFNANIDAKNILGHTPLEVARHLHNDSATPLLEAAQHEKNKCVAFAMGNHIRLGKESTMRRCDPEILRMILEQV
jgi:ankyrin repeat protein